VFVLLEHDVRSVPDLAPPRAGDVHWDLMLDVPGRRGLRTWRLLQNPLRTDVEIAAEPLGDHRRVYLDFEGDIGGGRGRVRQLDRGAATVLRDDGGVLRFELSGTGLCGVYEIVKAADGTALFRRIE
jgi:hypothetical protein